MQRVCANKKNYKSNDSGRLSELFAVHCKHRSHLVFHTTGFCWDPERSERSERFERSSSNSKKLLFLGRCSSRGISRGSCKMFTSWFMTGRWSRMIFRPHQLGSFPILDTNILSKQQRYDMEMWYDVNPPWSRSNLFTLVINKDVKTTWTNMAYSWYSWHVIPH